MSTKNLNLEEFVSVERILNYLAAKRIKRAELHKRIREKLQYNSNSELKQIIKNNANDKLLYGILPPRKEWKRPPKPEREKIKENVANHKHAYLFASLLYSYKKGYLLKSRPQLFDFINEIKTAIFSETYEPAKAITHLITKKTDCKSYRVIKEYSLKDSAVASLISKYLGGIFNRHKIFSCFSTNNRSVEDAFSTLIEYKNKRIEKCLYVCRKDIFSFFDLINPEATINSYDRLIERLSQTGITVDPICRRIIIAFLKSNNVFEDIQSYSCMDSRFKVIQSFRSENYSDSKPAIGISQGLPFTSLLANIFLEDIDREILYNYPNICYLRYVDDVLFIHPDKTICEDAVKYFENRIKEKKLLLHPPCPMSSNDAQDGYYLHKSTKVYTWSGSDVYEPCSKYIYYLGYKLPFDKRSNNTLQTMQQLKDLF